MSERDSVSSSFRVLVAPTVPQARSAGQYPARVKLAVILACFFGAMFTQYQAIAPCVILFHATWLAFLWMEPRWYLQFLSVVFLAIGLTLSMSQLFRPDDGPAWSWFSTGVVAGIQIIVMHAFWLLARVHIRLSRRSSKSITFFCYPVFVTSIYALVDLYSPIGSQGSIGYAFAEWQSFVQLVSLFGLTGLNFTILVMATAITHVTCVDVHDYRRAARLRTAAVVGIFMFTANWMFGSFRLTAPFMYQRSVFETSLPASDYVTGACIVRDYDTDMVERTEIVLKNNNVSFVVWSETAGGTFYNKSDSPWQTPVVSDLIHSVQSLSKRYNATIGFTYSVWAVPDDPSDETRFNMFSFVDPVGGLLVEYQKRHPVPVIESFVVPSSQDVANSTSTNIGPFNAAICFDFDYPAFIRQGTSTGLLIQTANTWGIVGHYHAISSAFRAIENGAYVVRCGSFGPSGVYDMYGNSIAYQTRHDSDVIFFQIPANSEKRWTFYSYFGYAIDYFFFAISAMYVIIFALSFRKPKAPTARVTHN